MPGEEYDALRWNLSGPEFSRVATALLRKQAGSNPVYGRFLKSFEELDAAVAGWEEFPALPVELFREEKVFCGPADQADFYFETSGSTSESKGRHWFRTAGYYEKSLELAFSNLMPPLARHAWVRLIPRREDRPHSSLAHMIDFLERRRGKGARGSVRVDGDFKIDVEGVREDLAVRFAGEPVALFGTSFALAHLAEDFLEAGTPVVLAEGSVLFETGGYKGRHRELGKDEFYDLMRSALGLRREQIWNEYGMTELSSQCYAKASEGIHRAPPWLRVRIMDPATGKLCGKGEKGLIEFVDLANVDSVAALATLDVGSYEGDGFRLHGRLKAAPLRGCSLGYEF